MTEEETQDYIEPKRLHDSLILVVDDVELNRKMLVHSLNAQGYHRVVMAADGSQALEMTHDLKPDLVILDLMMPTMDGFAYCKAVRQEKMYDNMPIIVQTALHDIDKKLTAFQMGASDYICKPIDPGELTARTKVHLSQKLMMEDLRTYRKRINAELDAAKAMQARLMPNAYQLEIYENVFNMKIAHHFKTSSALGGDCWGTRPLSENRLAIYMFDFSGHGTSAALNVFRMHTIMQECMHVGGEPGNFLSTLNRHLHPLLERDEFATMFYGVIDTDANCLLYASAATPPVMLFSKAEKEPIVLSVRGFPLGVVPNTLYETKYVPFVHEDLLLLYSDCLIETKNSAGEFLPEQQIKDTTRGIVSKLPQNPSVEVVESLIKLLDTHAAGVMDDDMTITAYWRCPRVENKN